MIIRIALGLLFSGLVLTLSAQNSRTEEIQDTSIKSEEPVSYNNSEGWALTYSPSALFNLFRGVQFGIEKCIAPNKFIELEAAYIPKQSGNVELFKSGYRVKLGLKQRTKSNFLLSGTLYLRKSFHQHREEVTVLNQFIQELEYRKTKTLIGPTLGLGYSKYFSERLGLEMSLIGGLGFYKVEIFDLPETAREAWTGWFSGYRDEGMYYYLIAGGSFKLKYKLSTESSKGKRGKKRRRR